MRDNQAKVSKTIAFWATLLCWLAGIPHAIAVTSDVPVGNAYASASVLDFPVSRNEVLALLSDTEALPRWLFMSESAALLDAGGDPSRARVHLFLKPMLGQPAQDAVLLAQSSVSADGKTVSIHLGTDPRPYPPAEPYLRITQMDVQIDVTTLAPALTRVSLTVQVTPAVPVPVMARPFTGMGAQLSLGYMQQLLAGGRYRDSAPILSVPRVRAFYRSAVLP